MTAIDGPGLADTGAGGRTAETEPEPETETPDGADRAGARWARWVWPAAYALSAVALFFCYLRVAGTQPVTSDGASMALQAWEMLHHGNWLLKGWSMTDVSFYTTEVPEFILVDIFRGLGPADVHTAAATTYTLLVVLAGLLAKGGKTGKARGDGGREPPMQGARGDGGREPPMQGEGLVRVLIASGVMIAPQIGAGAFLLLLSPDHTGTGVPLLLIFLLLDRAPRRPWVPAAAGLMLVWAQLGDRLVLTIGMLPLVAVCAVRAYRDIVQRREPVRERWFDLALAAAAIVSVGVSDVILKIIRHLGGYVSAPLNTTLAFSVEWPAHIALAAEGVLGLYGADFAGRPLGFAVAIALVHLVGLALAVWAVGRAIRGFFACDDLVTQVLTVAILANLAAYVFSVLPTNYWANREIANVLAFGAVLAGRLLAGRLMQARLLPALTAVACCYLVALGYGVTRALPPAHDQALADWLSAHHLSDGLGSYAEGNSVILDSHASILLVAPTWRAHSLLPGTHEAQASDFDPRQHYANFVVTTTQDGPAFHIPPAWIINTFGQAAHTYHYGVWTIMTYDKNLLDQVS
jgi:hypothetical protein